MSTPCGHKTTGDFGFTKWQVMMSNLGDTIIGRNSLQQMRIRQSIPVTQCLDTKNVLDTQSFVPAILVKISKTTWELMDENDDEMEQLVWDGDEGVKNLFGIYIKQPDEAFLSFL